MSLRSPPARSLHLEFLERERVDDVLYLGKSKNLRSRLTCHNKGSNLKRRLAPFRLPGLRLFARTFVCTDFDERERRHLTEESFPLNRQLNGGKNLALEADALSTALGRLDISA